MPAIQPSSVRLWPQLGRVAAFTFALTGLGSLVALEGFAAEPETLEFQAAPDHDDPLFATALSIPDAPVAEPAPEPELEAPPPKPKKKKHKKIKFGRMDAY